jgi:hypothetical protein
MTRCFVGCIYTTFVLYGGKTIQRDAESNSLSGVYIQVRYLLHVTWNQTPNSAHDGLKVGTDNRACILLERQEQAFNSKRKSYRIKRQGRLEEDATAV